MRRAGKTGGPELAHILDAVAFPTALYDRHGQLAHANQPFRDLWARLVMSDERRRCERLDDLAALLDLPPGGTRPGYLHEHRSATGHVTAFALVRLADGGWVLSASWRA